MTISTSDNVHAHTVTVDDLLTISGGMVYGSLVDAKAFGAAGNGIADDTHEIQNAINSLSSTGGAVLFSTGVYRISSPLIVDNDAISLIGLGQRAGAPIIQVAAGFDPAYALIVGNTKNVNSCFVSGLAFVGRNSTISTGKGILFRSNGGKILQTKVALFGGNGVEVNSFAGTNFENLLEDVELVQNGMNTTTPGDNLVILSGASDCEYHRIISQGDAAKSTTRNGILISSAGAQKFIDCHVYFCSNDGFNNVSGGSKIQIIGGAYETNGNAGIENAGPGCQIIGASLYSNGNTGIATYAQTSIEGCYFNANANDDIYANSANGGTIIGNTCSGSFTAIALDTGASQYVVADNNLAATTASVLSTKSTNSSIHDNTIAGGGNIVELVGAQSNNVHDNVLIGGGTITQVGTSTRIRNNSGFNPRGHAITQPAVPATGVAQTNTFGADAMVAVTGGTITQIAIGGTNTGLTSGTFRVPATQTITLTYSVAPTWQWFGD